MPKPVCVTLVIVAVLLSGCGDMMNGKAIAGSQVKTFHQQLNNSDINAILSSSDPSMPKASGEQLLSAVIRKLGNVTSTRTVGARTSFFNGRTLVTLVQETTFARGKGTETFTYTIKSGKAVLAGYNINSMDLLQAQSELQAIKITSRGKPFSGQILNLVVQGLSINPVPQEVPRSLKVTITQAGRQFGARVHSAAPSFVEAEPRGKLLPAQSISFTMPAGLVAGPALIMFSQGSQHSNQLECEIGDEPSPPGISVRRATTPVRADPRSEGPGLVFTRGQEAGFEMYPMIDKEEVPDAAVLLTFRQGELVLNVEPRIVHYPARQDAGRYYPSRDEVVVKAPEKLAPGPAEILLQYRLNGKVSPPIRLRCTVRQPD